MLNVVATVMRKELLDHLRDSRALAANLLYTLMGPLIVGLLVLVTAGTAGGPAMRIVAPVMASVFTLVAVFTGALALAVDSVAGERERRSLLPLVGAAMSASGIVLGKWLAVSVFALTALLLNLLAFSLILAFASQPPHAAALLAMIPGLVALTVLAASLELLVSMRSRNVKEANTYLGALMFGVMALAMACAFRPDAARSVWFLLPVAGQQRLVQLALTGGAITPLQSIVLAVVTALGATVVLLRAAALFQREEVLHGK